MIKIIYNDGCRLGNRLYMYAAGRLLARKLRCSLQSEPLEGFQRTRDVILGETKAVGCTHLNGADPIPTWPEISSLPVTDINIEHGWVNSRYFVNDREIIKTWFGGEPLMQVDPDDVLVNVRLKEFTPLGLTLDPIYYTTVLERMTFKKLYLMTDDPGNQYLDIFNKYNPIHITGYGIEHFFKAIAFKRIVMSNSTFCWWFTFISDAKEIYFPMINGNRCGSWCLGHLPVGIDLRWDWPEVTNVYNIPNWISPLPGPTDAERVEAIAFSKYSKTLII